MFYLKEEKEYIYCNKFKKDHEHLELNIIITPFKYKQSCTRNYLKYFFKIKILHFASQQEWSLRPSVRFRYIPLNLLLADCILIPTL